MNDLYTLPNSFIMFLIAALLVAPAQIFYRRKTGGREPDNHMRFIWAGAIPPMVYVLLVTTDLYRSCWSFLPLWLVYWTFYDIVYHTVLKLPEKKRKAGAGVVFAILIALLGFGVWERFAR